MKKKFVALFLLASFLVMGVNIGDKEVYAKEQRRNLVTSEFLSEREETRTITGYTSSQPRGVYLMEGVSTINDAGGGKIGCGGITSAAKKCKVSCNTIVERKVNGSWKRVTSWTDVKEDSYSAMVSEYLYVTSGYYYRVRSIHTAASDGSSSYTEGLKM